MLFSGEFGDLLDDPRLRRQAAHPPKPLDAADDEDDGGNLAWCMGEGEGCDRGNHDGDTRRSHPTRLSHPTPPPR